MSANATPMFASGQKNGLRKAGARKKRTPTEAGGWMTSADEGLTGTLSFGEHQSGTLTNSAGSKFMPKTRKPSGRLGYFDLNSTFSIAHLMGQ
jgi:hypothetical protein